MQSDVSFLMALVKLGAAVDCPTEAGNERGKAQITCTYSGSGACSVWSC